MNNPQPDDPKNPAGKPQGTLRDQQATMEGEGQPSPPAPDADQPTDPTVNAASIFEKLEEQAASERGDDVAEPAASQPKSE